ncbi:hypothetical protein Prudu_1073S001000 [Prunus dulcis]|uniref:Ubiquitin-like protease family profile domain-containing protein n=1 Tax=Prunus dulcis TaxID=3755 RepID=A0A5H2XUP3_PRUDU|nr:hypothetical protein Prudu_1073S001000 [Prunus dulcis]
MWLLYMRYLHDVLKQANMCSMVGFIDPATVSANSGTIADRSRCSSRLQKTDGEQIFMMPYNPGRHWILLIVRAKRETVYFLILCPEIVWSMKRQKHREQCYKIYNSHIAEQAVKQHTKATQQCRMRVLCDALHEDIIMDPSLAFEKKYAKGKQEAPYPQEAIDEVRNEWAEFVAT